MKKLLRVLENTALGIMVNGGFYLTMEGITKKAIIVTAVAFYVMNMAVIFQED